MQITPYAFRFFRFESSGHSLQTARAWRRQESLVYLHVSPRISLVVEGAVCSAMDADGDDDAANGEAAPLGRTHHRSGSHLWTSLDLL